MTRSVLACWLVVGLLGGCAAHLPVKGYSPTSNSHEKPLDLQLDPYQTVGISETEAIRNPANGTFVRCLIPDILLGGEFFPGRVRWNAWAVDKDGSESFGQVVVSSVERGRFYGLGIFDRVLTDEARVMILSTTLSFAYDFLGDKEFPLEGKKFREDATFRKDFVRENGTPIERLARMDGASAVARIKSWNGYQTPYGVLWSPLGWKEVESIAAINPQYSWTEKLGGEMHGSISMSAISTMAGVSLDIVNSTVAPEKGWDFNSQLPSRRTMALIVKVISDLKQRSIDEYFERQALAERRAP